MFTPNYPKMKKILILTFLIFFSVISESFSSHGISIFGDLKYPKDFTHFDYVNPNAPKGGSIKYGVEGTFNSLNPFILKGISVSGISMIFDSLMEDSADEISSKYGLIAESVKLSKDKKSITFKLRKIAHFHDGSKITADDVIFSFNKISKEGHPSSQMIYRDVIKAEKINDYEVKFTFKDNQNKQLPITISGLPIISKKYYQKWEFNKSTLEIPMGSGPYKVDKIEVGRSITYKRDKNYWAKDLPVNKGRHNFDEITYDYYRDGDILVESFKSGNFDLRQENISRNWVTSYNIEKVRNGEIIKKEVIHSLPTGMQAFVFNLRKEKFQNRKLREALNYAFDFEWVQKNIFYGSYQRTNSYFANTNFASSGIPSNQELEILKKLKKDFPDDVPDEIFSKIYQNPKSNASGFNRTNLLKAKKILEDAGYFVRDGKLIDPKTNQQLEIEFLINSKSFVMVIAPMKKNLAQLGIKSKIRLVDENQFVIRINEFDYDIIIYIFGQGLIPSDEQYSYWHSSLRDIKGSNNLSGTQNKATDYLLTKILKVRSKDQLELYTKALDRILLWNFYTIPQWHNNSYRILYKNKFATPKIIPFYSIGVDSWWAL